MFQNLVDILSWDHGKCQDEFYRVEVGQNGEVEVNKAVSCSDAPIRVCIENMFGNDGMRGVDKILQDLNWENISAFFFITNQKRQVKHINQLVQSLAKGSRFIYGVDPDYFHSVVPLTSTNRKNIERYILSLRPARNSLKRIKKFIKKFLILFNMSTFLYEQFIYCFYPDS